DTLHDRKAPTGRSPLQNPPEASGPWQVTVTDQLFAVHVECYAGYRGEETPVRFRLGERVIEVAEVLDRWLAPDHRYFKVGADGDVYILRNDTTSGGWEMTIFKGASRP